MITIKIFVLLLCLIYTQINESCSPKQTTLTDKGNEATTATSNTYTTTPTSTVITDNDYTTTSTGKKIRKAEMGITIVNPNGWSKSDMEFHLEYCAKMFAQTPEVDPNKFCPCFLEKIQYYYEPIYFKEAYEHQQKWNTECFMLAKIK